MVEKAIESQTKLLTEVAPMMWGVTDGKQIPPSLPPSSANLGMLLFIGQTLLVLDPVSLSRRVAHIRTSLGCFFHKVPESASPKDRLMILRGTVCRSHAQKFFLALMRGYGTDGFQIM